MDELLGQPILGFDKAQFLPDSPSAVRANSMATMCRQAGDPVLRRGAVAAWDRHGQGGADVLEIGERHRGAPGGLGNKVMEDGMQVRRPRSGSSKGVDCDREGREEKQNCTRGCSAAGDGFFIDLSPRGVSIAFTRTNS